MKRTKGNGINGKCVGWWVYAVVFWAISAPGLIFPKRSSEARPLTDQDAPVVNEPGVDNIAGHTADGDGKGKDADSRDMERIGSGLFCGLARLVCWIVGGTLPKRNSVRGREWNVPMEACLRGLPRLELTGAECNGGRERSGVPE